MSLNVLLLGMLFVIIVIALNRLTITYYRSRESKHHSYDVYRIKMGRIFYILIYYENLFTRQSCVILDIGEQNKFVFNLSGSIELVRYNLVQQKNKILLELQFYNHKLFYLLDIITMQEVLLDPSQQDEYELIVRMTNKVSIH